MALQDLSDQQAVRDAIREFDALGREAFLAKYGFGEARGYFVRLGDKQYDSKAIAGAAHGHQFGVPLLPSEFSGGDATVATRLESLGFEVTRPARLPDWSRDELMLALDMYLKTRGRMGYGTGNKDVIALSDELR